MLINNYCLRSSEKKPDVSKEDVIERLRQAMTSHPRHDRGYLRPEDMVELSLAYLTVYNVGVSDTGHIRHCINIARSHSIYRGLVSVDIFLKHL